MQNNLSQSMDPPNRVLSALVEKLHQGSLDEVLEVSESLAKQHHGSIHVWNLLGSAAFQKGDPELAETALKNVVSLSSKDPVAFANLARSNTNWAMRKML